MLIKHLLIKSVSARHSVPHTLHPLTNIFFLASSWQEQPHSSLLLHPPVQGSAALQTQRACSMSAAVHKEQYDQQWLEAWQGGLQPGQFFDAGNTSPLLRHLLGSGQLAVQDKKTVVPGCGRGYDVFAFASAGASVSVGLDLSPEAVAAAKAEQQAQLGSDPAACGAVHLAAGDFFVHSSSPNFQGPYDIGYDYTFLCALHPDMRQDWARAWADILAPGGELVTLIFPVGSTPPGAPQNPPWAVTPELYQQLLLPAGFEQVVLEPVPHELSHKPRAGREWLGRWRRVVQHGGSSSSSAGSGGQDTGTPSSNL